MQKRFHFYILILILGAFLLPSVSYACESHSEKSCCKKERSAPSEKKKCCKESPSKKENKGCEGKCGHSNCTSASVNSIFAVFSGVEFNSSIADFSSEKQKFHNFKTFVLSGHSSIWLIPKIG